MSQGAPAHPDRNRRKLYGRRKGPKLSGRQADLRQSLLPKLALNLKAGSDPRDAARNGPGLRTQRLAEFHCLAREGVPGDR